jgi:hypothetical protein
MTRPERSAGPASSGVAKSERACRRSARKGAEEQRGGYSATNSEGTAAQRHDGQGRSNAARIRRAAQDRRWW